MTFSFFFCLDNSSITSCCKTNFSQELFKIQKQLTFFNSHKFKSCAQRPEAGAGLPVSLYTMIISSPRNATEQRSIKKKVALSASTTTTTEQCACVAFRDIGFSWVECLICISTCSFFTVPHRKWRRMRMRKSRNVKLESNYDCIECPGDMASVLQ